MDIIKRKIEDLIIKDLFKGKAIIIIGARQVGKTTLVNQILKKVNKPFTKLDGDYLTTRNMFANAGPEQIERMIGNNKILYIDEAQRIENIGLVIKIITDNFRNVQVIATGSSAFRLNDTIKEPLTGRKYEYYLYPFSFDEMVEENSFITEKGKLDTRLIYGYYPEITLNSGNETRLLNLIAGDYLFKDILNLEFVKGSKIIENILKALAYQVGSEVSFTELSRLTGVDYKTVIKYTGIMEQSYIIFRLDAYSKNKRTELRRNRKIYFYDNGIRNAIIGNFNNINNRTDAGALWENFIISERIKYLKNNGISANSYFWRTTQQQEIDYIEEREQKLFAYEFKYNKNAKAKFSKSFTNHYKVEKTAVITPDNLEEFLM